MKIMLNEDEVRAGVCRVAAEVQQDLGDRPLTIVGVLTGSLIFLADLIRLLKMPQQIGVLRASSYRGGTSPGELEIETSLLPDLQGRHVLVVDDIFDTGHTLKGVTTRLQELGAASLHSAVLLRKHGRQEIVEQPDYAAFEIPNEFVVGYGLDYRGGYRNLPYVAVLEPEDLRESPE